MRVMALSAFTGVLLLCAGCAAETVSAPMATQPARYLAPTTSPRASTPPSSTMASTAVASSNRGLGMPITVQGSERIVAFDDLGRQRYSTDAGAMSGDSSTLIQTAVAGDATTLTWRDTSDGRETFRRTLAGRWQVSAVSFDGRQAALADASYEPVPSGQLAANRTHSNIAIVSSYDRAPSVVALDGNLLPEAFVQDRDALAVIEFLPAQHPTRYRVRILDVAPSWFLNPPFKWNEKETLDQTMEGLRGANVVTNNGQFLYTLYRASNGTAFVHALDLSMGSQYCIDLPPQVTDARTGALAASADGQHLYVLTSTGTLVTIATNTVPEPGPSFQTQFPAVIAVAAIGSPDTGARPALAISDTSIYASLGHALITIDRATGATSTSRMTDAATGLTAGPTGQVVLAVNDHLVWRATENASAVELPGDLGPLRSVRMA